MRGQPPGEVREGRGLSPSHNRSAIAARRGNIAKSTRSLLGRCSVQMFACLPTAPSTTRKEYARSTVSGGPTRMGSSVDSDCG